jgi:hypothetical protein
MSADRTAPPNSWDWLTGEHGRWSAEVLSTLTFARGLSESQLLTGFGMDPATAVPMTEDQAVTAQHGVTERTYWVRVTRVGDWGVAFEPNDLSARLDYLANLLATMSSEVASICVVTPSGLSSLDYYLDGVLTTGLGIDDGGTIGPDPTRFDDALAAVGMGTQPQDDFSFEERIGRVLEMLTNTLGVSLPESVYLGPMLTASRTEPYSYQPWAHR